MDNVVSLRGDAPGDVTIVDQEIVDLLEDLLEKAKRGEIAAFGYFGARPGRHTFNGWIGAGKGYKYELAYACDDVKFRFMRMNVDPEDCDEHG